VDLSALECFPDHLFHGIYLGAQFGVWVLPLPIQVEPCQTASIVSNNYSVWVEHRHNLEYISVSKSFGFPFVADDELEKALHYEAGI
jgi:hypothetical protein